MEVTCREQYDDRGDDDSDHYHHDDDDDDDDDYIDWEKAGWISCTCAIVSFTFGYR